MMHRPLFPICLMSLGLLAACAGSTCPVGSRAMGDQCVPFDGCPAGRVRRNGECAVDDDMPAIGPDASTGGTGGLLPDDVPDTDAGTSNPDAGSVGAADTGAPDSNMPVDPMDPCAGFDCGGHGACQVDMADAPYCACEEGFAGERCDACEAGLGLSDEGTCVALCEAADRLDCGPHGECVVADSTASCTCTHPYTGDSCELCAEGYALEGGVCTPECGECGRHSFCDATPLVPECKCVPGYDRKAGGCTWAGNGVTGGIIDEELENPAAWRASDVKFNGGIATFGSSGVGNSCRLGVLAQTVRMPAREDAEPFVLDIETLTSCTFTNPDSCPALLV